MLDLLLSVVLSGDPLPCEEEPAYDCYGTLRIENVGRLTPFGNTYRFYIDPAGGGNVAVTVACLPCLR